jgi:hypothetical protein
VTYVYTVDRSQRTDLRGRHLSESEQTAWHRARPTDEGLAACSRRIVLNTEDRSLTTSNGVGRLCRRCFPERRQSDGQA